MPQANQPAPVSGPGQLSRRTDGGPAQKLMNLPDAKYGEQQAYQQAQRGAPLAQSPGTPSSPPINAKAQGVVPFSAPTQNPAEPVTSGAAAGAGPGPEALGISPQQVEQGDVNSLAKYMPVLEYVANLPDASAGARLFVNMIKGSQGGSSS